MKNLRLIAALCGVTLLAGCAGYTWGTSVPEEFRTVAVPLFENLTEVAEMGPMVTQYTLREFQREGSFRIVRPADAAIEVQGVVRKMDRRVASFDRTGRMRA